MAIVSRVGSPSALPRAGQLDDQRWVEVLADVLGALKVEAQQIAAVINHEAHPNAGYGESW